MAEKERLVSFSLLGQEFSFYTGASEDELNRILALVRTLLEESGSGYSSGTIPLGKTAILACLNIASRYVRLKQDFEEYKKDSELRAGLLANQIDARLPSEKTE